MAGGLTTRIRFLPVILTSLGSESGTPFYPNRRNSQHHFDALTRNLFFVELSGTSGHNFTRAARLIPCDYRLSMSATND